jgi:hypothetical protein
MLQGVFPCCGWKSGEGCKTARHTYPHVPKAKLLLLKESQPSPKPVDSDEYLTSPKRAVVVLDSAIVEVPTGEKGPGGSEVIGLTAIDFQTGDILVNKLIEPSDVPVDWQTATTRIDKKRMKRARTLTGYEQARAELMTYINADTILVGHGLQATLCSLRLIHDRIVDNQILLEKARPSTSSSRPSAVDRIASELLGRPRLKQSSQFGDVGAIKDIVSWFANISGRPESWPEAFQETVEKTHEKRKAKLEKKQKRRDEASGSAFKHESTGPGDTPY